jgi:beta-hydroxylase
MIAGVSTGETGSPPPQGRNPRRPFLYRSLKKLRHRIGEPIARASRVGNDPVLEPGQFSWIAALEREWPEIRREVMTLIGSGAAIPPIAEVSPDNGRIAPGDGWRSFFLWGYGYKAEANCRACPVTSAAVEKIPGLNTAMISILAPGTHIPRHRGVTKAILVAHLPLSVPKEVGCRMQVADQDVAWREGKTLVFDDTYPHEVWNDTNEPRVLLLIQFRRPLAPVGRLIGEMFLFLIRRSPYVKEARRNVARWSNSAIP